MNTEKEQEFNIAMEHIHQRLAMANRIRRKIAALEKVLQDATKLGMSGKITISTDQTLIKTKEEFNY